MDLSFINESKLQSASATIKLKKILRKEVNLFGS